MTAMTFGARDVSDGAAAASQCAILPLFQGKSLSGPARELNKAASGAIKSALDLGDFSAKSGQTLMLPGTGSVKRILLIGCGDPQKFDREGMRKFAAACRLRRRALPPGRRDRARRFRASLALEAARAPRPGPAVAFCRGACPDRGADRFRHDPGQRSLTAAPRRMPVHDYSPKSLRMPATKASSCSAEKRRPSSFVAPSPQM